MGEGYFGGFCQFLVFGIITTYSRFFINVVKTVRTYVILILLFRSHVQINCNIAHIILFFVHASKLRTNYDLQCYIRL